MAGYLITICVLFVAFFAAKVSAKGRPRWPLRTKFYEQAVTMPTSTKPQSEFGIAGPVQAYPYSSGYAAAADNKLTKTPDYNSTQVGSLVGLLVAPSTSVAYASFILVLQEGSIPVAGVITSNSSLATSSGTGVFLGTYGTDDVSIVSGENGNYVVLHDITIYKN